MTLPKDAFKVRPVGFSGAPIGLNVEETRDHPIYESSERGIFGHDPLADVSPGNKTTPLHLGNNRNDTYSSNVVPERNGTTRETEIHNGREYMTCLG